MALSYSRAMHSYFAHLQPLVELRAAEWWRMLKNNFGPVEILAAINDAGNTNNSILRTSTMSSPYAFESDKQLYLGILNEYTCLAWTSFILDDFNRQRRQGQVPQLCMGIGRSGQGTLDEHTFAMCWDKGALPFVTGIIIDPWPTQGWDWETADVLQAGRKPYQLFAVNSEKASFYDSHNNWKTWKRLDPDQMILFESWRHKQWVR